jgi:hypothetical protein
MEEKLLLKIALVCSIAGIFLLFIISNELPPNEKAINNLENNENVVLSGKITKIYDKGDLMIAELSQYNKISVVIYKKDYLDLRVNDNIEVTGTTTEYNCKLEIMADEVRLV